MIICDIDGVLNKMHQRFISYHPSQDATNREIMREAEPVPEIIALLQDLNALGKYIVLITGRPARYCPETEEWLARHKVVYSELFMRPDDAICSDSTFKKSVYLNELKRNVLSEDVEFVIEDRNSVVVMWRSLGLVCFQPFPGDF